MWTFNVARELLRLAGHTVLPTEIPRQEKVTGEILQKVLNDLNPGGIYALKTHTLYECFPHARFIINHRDLRDVMISFMRFMNLNFEEGLEGAIEMIKTEDHFMKFPKDVTLHLEFTELTSNPLNTVVSIMKFLRLKLGQKEIDGVVEKFTKENVKRLITDTEQNIKDRGAAGQLVKEGEIVPLEKGNYMKSLYIPDSFDGFSAQSKFDRSVQKLGVFDFSNYGPNANYFNDTLQELGWVVDGFDLRRSCV